MIGGELDSGDIIARDYLEIDEATTITKVWEWLNNRIPELCLEAIKNLSTDASYVLQRQSKNPVDALRCYPRKLRRWANRLIRALCIFALSQRFE